jgi:hypothetical protein
MINLMNYNSITDFNLIDSNYKANNYIYKDLEFISLEQLFLFRKLKELINNCYKNTISFKKQIIALEFCLTTHTTIYLKQYLYTFNTICSILGLHPDIVRLRLMYEFYLQKHIINLEYIDSNIKINPEFASEILLSIRDFSVIDIANYIFCHPSISIVKVREVFLNVDGILEKFILNGYVARYDEHLYFIGKNPLLHKFNWSLII